MKIRLVLYVPNNVVMARELELPCLPRRYPPVTSAIHRYVREEGDHIVFGDGEDVIELIPINEIPHKFLVDARGQVTVEITYQTPEGYDPDFAEQSQMDREWADLIHRIEQYGFVRCGEEETEQLLWEMGLLEDKVVRVR